MSNTSLTKRELAILEKIISSLGHIAYVDDINKLLENDYSIQEIRRQLSLLNKRGWLVRIKRGVFAVASLESHSFANISPLAVSQILVPESYVSFEFALAYHGLFDQLPSRVTAVTPGKPKKYAFQNMSYEFRKIKPDLYFGYREIRVNGDKSNVAVLEKVFLDFLYFRIDTYSIDMVLEKLIESGREIDLDRLSEYAVKYPVSVKRRIGYLLELAEMPAGGIYEQIKSRRDSSRLTNQSDRFDARWRLYYEDRFSV